MKVLAYRGRSIVSRLVKWRTRSEYSHVAIQLGDGSVIEAWHKGGVQHNASYRTAHTPGTVVDIFDLNPVLIPSIPNHDAMIDFLQSQIGKKYDWGLIAGFMTNGRRRKENDRWICSELVFAALSHGGIKLLERIPAGEVSPRLVTVSPLLKHVGSVMT